MTTVDTPSIELDELVDATSGPADSAGVVTRSHEEQLGPIEAGTISEFVDYVLSYFVVAPTASRRRQLMVALPLLAFLGGAFVTVIGPTIGTAFIGLVVLIGITAYQPRYAGYIMVAVAPAIVGFGRGQILPLLRPNEALLFLLWVVLAARWLLYSRRFSVKLNRMDWVMIGLILTGLVIPLLVQFARLRPVSADDVFYGFVLVRLGLLYGIIRYTIRTPGEVRTAVGLSLAVASGLGLLGLMDSLNVFDTAERLNPYFPGAGPTPDDGRGAATIGNPIGFGVYCGINACLAIAMLLGGERPRPVLGIAALCCGIGVFGSGQIGPSLSFVIGLGVLAIMTKSVRRLVVWSLPFLLFGSIVIAPLAQERLAGFDGPQVSGAQRQSISEIGGQEESRALYEANPGSSWDVRLYNLRTFFIPEFEEDLNLLLGVSPQARVPSPNEGEDFIWIESGHLWLLWSGGVPLFIMFFVFVGVGMATSRRVMRTVAGPVGICGAAAFAGLVILSVAQTFDPHLTLRGTSDILFPLLALVMVGWVRPDRSEIAPTKPRPTLLYVGARTDDDLGPAENLDPESDRDRDVDPLLDQPTGEIPAAAIASSEVNSPVVAAPEIATDGAVLVAAGDSSPKRFTIVDSPIRVGRGDDCQVQLTDNYVSRVHLVLTWNSGAWLVSDHSKHGTYNKKGRQLDGSVELTDVLDLRLGGKRGKSLEIGLLSKLKPKRGDR